MRSRWFAAAKLPWRTRCNALSMGGRVHHVRLTSHRARLPLVAVQRWAIQALSQVSMIRELKVLRNLLETRSFVRFAMLCLALLPVEVVILVKERPFLSTRLQVFNLLLAETKWLQKMEIIILIAFIRWFHLIALKSMRRPLSSAALNSLEKSLVFQVQANSLQMVGNEFVSSFTIFK